MLKTRNQRSSGDESGRRRVMKSASKRGVVVWRPSRIEQQVSKDFRVDFRQGFNGVTGPANGRTKGFDALLHLFEFTQTVRSARCCDYPGDGGVDFIQDPAKGEEACVKRAVGLPA